MSMTPEDWVAAADKDRGLVDAVRRRTDEARAAGRDRQAATERRDRLHRAFRPLREFGFHRTAGGAPWLRTVTELRLALLRLNDDLGAEGFGGWLSAVEPAGTAQRWVMDLLGEDHARAVTRLAALLEAAHPHLNEEPLVVGALAFVRGLYQRFRPVIDLLAPPPAEATRPTAHPPKSPRKRGR